MPHFTNSNDTNRLEIAVPLGWHKDNTDAAALQVLQILSGFNTSEDEVVALGDKEVDREYPARN